MDFLISSAANSTNRTNHHVLDDLPMDSNFVWLLCSLIFAISWIMYIAYYNSRVTGYIITKIVNRLFVRNGFFKIGSFTLNALSGKIMFRDVVYITHDYSVRIQDGYLIFRWWRSYVPKDVSEDLSHSDTRLSVVLNGFELHVYNRCELYARLERKFGLNDAADTTDGTDETAMNNENSERSDGVDAAGRMRQRPEAAMARTWRDLIPVIKMDVSSGRLVFGNRLVPTTLSVTVEESHFVYSTKPAASTLDKLMHFSKCWAENARVMLAPSPKYTGMLDEPPRYMGEGFVLMATNYLELYMYMDEPGVVPAEPVLLRLANGDIVESAPPMWGVDIKCGKGTDFSYGPWADRQREHLFRFFFPNDFQSMQVTRSPQPGDKRQMQTFDIRLSMLNEATIDVLFSKNKETSAVHVNVGAGSYLEITLPWITLQDGFTTKINGQLLHLEATTSLQYRDLVSSETLEFAVSCHYPLIWNYHQQWELSLTGCKATVNLVYAHKNFFSDLVNDWSSKHRPDLMHFVPYTWRFGLTLKHCEVLTCTNLHNWLDCSSVGQMRQLENARVALCAHLFHLSFELPFDRFLPDTIPLAFSIQAESIDLSLYIPDVYTSRNVVLALEKYAKLLSKEGGLRHRTENIPKWRNACQKNAGWVDFWWVPIGAVSIQWLYHPAPPLGPQPQADISTPVKEELLLSPMRFPHCKKRTHRSPDGNGKFDPTTLAPDCVTVELEIGPSVLLLYGIALRHFLHLKENIFGDDQLFTDMHQTCASNAGANTERSTNDNNDGFAVASDDESSVLPVELQDDFDLRYYRPLEVDVSIILHDIQAHLLKHCSDNEPPCPVVLVERFGFEMKKRYDQTELQLLLSPSVLLVSDTVNRGPFDSQLNQGRMTLSSLQIRGHAMFSDQNKAIDEDTIEYAWLLEIQLGKLSGKITMPQLYQLVTSLETMLLLMIDSENELCSSHYQTTQRTNPNLAVRPSISNTTQPNALQTFLHSKQPTTTKPNPTQPASSTSSTHQQTTQTISNASAMHKFKYKFCRATVDAIDLWLVESGAALQLWVSPVRVSTCNLHGKQVGAGLSCVIYNAMLRQLVSQVSTKQQHSLNDTWLEVGSVQLGTLVVESVMSPMGNGGADGCAQAQQKFLRIHDEKSKRLWFLWPEVNKGAGKCGCVGGCVFFGANRNGARFFKPSRTDLVDGTNIAAFRINEAGRDVGYGQSILHEGQLVFRTPPYTAHEVYLHETDIVDEMAAPPLSASPIIAESERRATSRRRFSYTPTKNGTVPYARLVEANACAKVDSDTKLHTDRKSVLNVPVTEPVPKNSVSDSKLAVDYFCHGKCEFASVDASESQHSLSTKLSLDETSRPDVERTVSISSENQSDAFFSADEELNQSQTSSLRHSDSVAIPVHKKRFASDLSIGGADGSTAADHRGTNSGPHSLNERVRTGLSSHRSDHEIHTPEHRNFITHRSNVIADDELLTHDEKRTVQGLVTPNRKISSSTLRSLSPRFPETLSTTPKSHQSSSAASSSPDSRSLSSNSYASAMCSQEDVTLVDLHVQANRQIIDSPLLMSSYVSHLSQTRCTNWTQCTRLVECNAFSVPMFHRTADGKLLYVGGQYVPQMEPITDGLTLLKMVPRTIDGTASPTVWDEPPVDVNVECDATGDDSELLMSRTDACARTAVIVRLQGDLDVTITPVLLECLQRFVDALIPTLSMLHPLNVVSHLHSSCVNQVIAANVLKRDEDIATRIGTASTYEEYIKTQLQIAVALPRVNITLLQAAVVEDVITFSALDNIRDLTCVSLFTICFDDVTARFHQGRQARELVQMFYRPAVVQSDGKKGSKGPKAFLLHQPAHTNADVVAGEPVYIETSEKQQEEMVVSLTIGKAHAQLRRLRNECTILNDAVITAIPVQHSRVMFVGCRMHPYARGVEYYRCGTVRRRMSDDLCADERLGFIMFECGLEGISIKIVKRSQFERTNGDAEAPECVRSGDGDLDSINERQSNASTQTTAASQKTDPPTGLPPPPPTPPPPPPSTSTTTNETNAPLGGVTIAKETGGNTSSCVLDLKVVWFNFAAPPRAPITRKLDYTRLDWNLLSTASPAINAWMNPSNRFAIRVVQLFRSMYRRSTGVIACLMTEALDMQGIHMPVKSKYDKLTPLAKTLQEDPSCQLCTILEKYMLQTDVALVEINLRETDLPQLSTLRQGVIVLSRQWKNVLYTPLLLEHNYKSRHMRPLNVTFATVPELLDDEMCLTDGEASGNDEPDVTDECAMLLRTEALLKSAQAALKPTGIGGIPSVPENSPRCPMVSVDVPHVAVISEGIESVLTSPSPPMAPHRRHRKGLPPTQNPTSSRASVVFPILSGGNPFTSRRPRNDSIGYGTLREDKIEKGILGRPDSDPSVCSQSSPELIAHGLGIKPTHTAPTSVCNEDLYSWMAKQQEYVNGSNHATKSEPDVSCVTPAQVPPDSKVNTLGTDSSGEVPAGVAGVSLYPMQDSLRLLDAHMIFQPLLSSLGVMPEQMVGATSNVTSLDALGSNLSLVGGMDQLRIDIVVSENGKGLNERRKSRSGKSPHLRLDVTYIDESPAFICERVVIELEVDKMADMTVDDMIRTRNVLYISRGQLKKHTSTALNFNIGIKYISQQVNMPLLRLLHQISNMYQNVKDTQHELREQSPAVIPIVVPEAIVANNSSSTSDVHEDRPPLTLKVSDASSIISHGRPVLSPSASVRSRPQSFAQKLRSTGKSVRGYMNLGDGVGTSLFATGSPSVSGGLTVGSDKSTGAPGTCWKTVYHLLDLYATMPETKTITHRFSMAADISEHYKGATRKYDLLSEAKSVDDFEKNGHPTSSTPLPPKELGVVTSGERTRLVVFGIARIHRTRLLATLSGLKLEAEITSLHSSLTCRKKSRPVSLEFSLTGQVGRTMIVLLEGVAPNQQTVVKVTVGKSQALYSSVSKRTKDKNSGLLSVGAVNIDIPQHPVALHGMVTRGSKQLSSTLQELRVSRTSSRVSRGSGLQPEPEDVTVQHSPHHQTSATTITEDNQTARPVITHTVASIPLLRPLVMQFSVILQSVSITAALLPSLHAQYKMDQVNSTGVTGSKAKFTIDLPRHSLSFTTKLQASEANLPSEASIALPAVHITAEYVPEGGGGDAGAPPPPRHQSTAPDGLILKQGGYLAAHADIGVFEHSLTTDLLNHLVFVQKVFMKEVNEVVQKVYGGERPVRLWSEDANDDGASSWLSRILFSLVIRIQRIQLTATTAGSSAVRLETGAVALELSNRVQNVSDTVRLFGKAQVDINLCLGQLTRNAMFEEAEPDFQQFAFFDTRVGLRNAFQDETVADDGDNKEVVLITLKRPLVYIQPLAVDKAILVWLNYKNAYEYWNEKRANLNKEVLTATQQVLERVPFGQLAPPNLGTLFLQLTIDDMGICVPLNPLPLPLPYDESRGAVVVTLESTSIAACSSGSLVSKGRFANLCLRFADDFDPSLDDWKPDMSDTNIMNLCVVSEGTYEVCSRTVAAKRSGDNAKWFLNVQWQMEGVDINLDVNVGKQLSALGHTLTMLTGAEDGPTRSSDVDEDDDSCSRDEQGEGSAASQESVALIRNRRWTDSLPPFVFDPTLDAKKRSKLIEKEMNEQAKIINDLRSLGASNSTIEQEMRRLHELEAMVFKDFRRDMLQKLRRQSVKASSIKGKLGLGSRASAYRSRSFVAPSPMLERRITIESPLEEDVVGNASASGTSVSYESSPRLGPSRTASLRVRNLTGPRVTFSDTQAVYRQCSLPSASSELSLPDDQLKWSSDHMDVDGERVELRKKPTTPSASQKPQEPNIDFELDVKVLINSGKCVLHTKDPAKEDELKLNRMRKDRSCSAGLLEFPGGSPDATRRHKDKSGSTRFRGAAQAHPNQLIDLTIFHIPGMDVKLHYESRIVLDDSVDVDDETTTNNRKTGVKKASLFTWMTLQSIPEETIISPHILEFLEQALEPIPSKVTLNTSGQATSFNDTDLSTYGTYVYTSFPVDVVVYFHMQPSTFRFSCLPVSRVECMLQLPSLDIVFSSKRAEGEAFGEADDSKTAAIGGLSVTGCLADFSVYIFHPYGGGKKSSLKEAQWSPLADSERKDSLSVNVEFVKFHLSRSRKLNFQHESDLSGKLSEQSRAIIRFSTIVDIGSASFKYDMRRLTEILAFPKAWYRRSIVRRLFLGDLSTFGTASSDDIEDTILEEEPAANTKHGLSRSAPTGPATATSDHKSPQLGRDKLRLSLEGSLQRRSGLQNFSRAFSTDSTPSPSEVKGTAAWETLVLFAINFTKLNVHMNMGNVMGNVTWQTKDFRSESRLSIGSTGHKNMYIALSLGGSSLDAKGGIVGGTIEIAKIDTYVHIREEPSAEPDHIVGLKLYALELRFDYMGTCVLMSRVSALDVTLRDEWRLKRMDEDIACMPTRRLATIFLHGVLGWDQLQLIMSKSSTTDLVKMYHKLEEFFSQQFNSSRRVFSRLGPNRPVTRSHSRTTPTTTATSTMKPRHHRHWQKALAHVAGLHLSTMHFPLPNTGTVLGGTVELHGKHISLACFHGINFKSKSWALFSLCEPSISFNAEAQEIPMTLGGALGGVLGDIHVVQTLIFSLGLSHYKTHQSMATVCKVSRNVIFPPQFKSLQEWFHYAFASSTIDEVDRFPSLERERSESSASGTNSIERARAAQNKQQNPNHTREVIFALPSLQLHLKTEHLQTTETPDEMHDKPIVECSFVTEFEDHIFVTVDAEAFFFLHDLITSYLKEKERVVASSSVRASSPDPDKTKASTEDETPRKKATHVFSPEDIFTTDRRHYECKTWHLEPTVRLLSWAGKSIEPYGVDYILQKLGFNHARTTIPKSVQRGFMDPMDKVLAVLTLRMVSMIKDVRKKEDDSKLNEQ